MISSSKTRSTLAALAVGITTCSTPGCVSAPQPVVDPPPPLIPCPKGAAQTYKQYIPKFDDLHGVYIPHEDGEPPRLRNGGTINTFLVGRWGAIPDKAPAIGRVWFGKDRIYGRLTEIILPSGEHLPVCLYLDFNGPGIPMRPGSTRTEALTTPSISAIVVRESLKE